jgi:DNA-binding response OmpR family regulator
MKRILAVEDQPDYQIMIRTLLERHYSVVTVPTFQEALKRVHESDFDLVLLDVNLPDGSGFQLFSQLKAIAKMDDVPVIFLTGQSEVSSRVTGLSLGAEDYIVKPFEPLEFIARVDSKLKARHTRNAKLNRLKKGCFQLDLMQMRAFTVQASGELEALDLTPTEFKLLSYFLTREGHVLSREQLTEHLWSFKIKVSDRTVDRHVSGLRLKLKPEWANLESIRSLGYRFSITELRQ